MAKWRGTSMTVQAFDMDGLGGHIHSRLLPARNITGGPDIPPPERGDVLPIICIDEAGDTTWALREQNWSLHSQYGYAFDSQLWDSDMALLRNTPGFDLLQPFVVFKGDTHPDLSFGHPADMPDRVLANALSTVPHFWANRTQVAVNSVDWGAHPISPSGQFPDDWTQTRIRRNNIQPNPVTGDLQYQPGYSSVAHWRGWFTNRITTNGGRVPKGVLVAFDPSDSWSGWFAYRAGSALGTMEPGFLQLDHNGLSFRQYLDEFYPDTWLRVALGPIAARPERWLTWLRSEIISLSRIQP